MNMSPAAVQQRAGIAFAVDFPADRAGIQQLQLRVAVAFPVGFLLFQRLQLLMVQGNKQPAGTIVALDLIALNTLPDDFPAFKHHAPKDFGSIGAIVFLNHVDIAAVGVNQLAAVASAGTEADARPFKEHHVVAHFSEMQCGGEAGITAAYHAHVTAD